MSDPLNGQFTTAGNPYVAADGATFRSTSNENITGWESAFGLSDAPIVWAEFRNRDLLGAGRAIQTPHGVMSLDNVRFALGKAGYTGPQDAGSLASAYQLLQSPPQPVPAPAPTATASASVGGLSLSGGIGGIPRPVLYLGAALLAYELLFSGRRRLL